MNIYALTLGLGAALGLYRVSRQRSGQWLDAALLALLFCLLGARLGFVLQRSAYYSAHPGEFFLIANGGLSGSGALSGFMLGLGLAAALYRVSLLRLADWFYPLLPPLAVTGFLANWLAGAAYGPQLPVETWWAVHLPDELGVIAPRWPLLPTAAVALLVFYGLLELLLPLPRPSGWLASLALAWFAAVSLVVSRLRVDPLPHWPGLEVPLDTVIYAAFLAVFLCLFGVLTWMDRKKTRMGSK